MMSRNEVPGPKTSPTPSLLDLRYVGFGDGATGDNQHVIQAAAPQFVHDAGKQRHVGA